MSLLDFITGKKKSSSQQSQQSTTKQTQKSDKTSVGRDTQSQTSQRGSVTGTEQQTASDRSTTQRTLSAPITAALEQQLLSLIGGTQSGALPGSPDAVASPSATTTQADLTNSLANRALGADQTSSDAISAIVEASRASGERTLTRSTTNAAQQAGSSFNSFVQELGARGSADLETQLAGLQGQLGLQARQSGTQELLGAVEAFGRTSETGAGELSTLVDALKGSVTSATEVGGVTQTGRSEEQETINSLQEILRALQESTDVESISDTQSSGQGSTKQPSTALDFLNVFASA